MAENLETLGKQFILDEDMEHENLQDLVSRTLKFCKVDKNGHVVISGKKRGMPDRIMLVLTARHLANKLQPKLKQEITIKEEADAEELAKILSEKKAVISARLKELKDEKKVVLVSAGVYRVAQYAIEDFLKKLEGAKDG